MAESERDAPLAGLRVLEFTENVAGPYCGRLLADYGAAVLKVEPPDGDPVRGQPPLVPARGFPRRVGQSERLESPDIPPLSLLYLYLNHHKSLITLDLRAPDAASRCLDLARQADLLIENLAPGMLGRCGLGWNRLHNANPRLVVTSISPFGQSGPYRDYLGSDIVCDAVGGLAYVFGYPEREPLTHPSPQAQYRAGTCAASASVAALLNVSTGPEPDATGSGERIDVSIAECVTSALREVIPSYTYMGAIRRRSAAAAGTFGDVVACADGFVIPSVWGAGDWPTLTRFLDAPEMNDERFATGEGRERYAAELAQMLADHLASRRRFEFFHEAQAWGIGAGIVLTPAEVAASEQLAARGFFQSTDLDDGVILPVPRGPFPL